MLGRDPQQQNPTRPYFALVDEASKLNLNTATLAMLQALPGMTAEFAAAIIDWRDADSEVTQGGAEDETYLRLVPPYHCKNAKFESLEELRLVYGSDLTVLYGEDANRNGVLDANEDDGDITQPADNRDGKLDPGLLEYLTVYSREANTNADGTARIGISGPGLAQRITPLLQSKFTAQRAGLRQAILGSAHGGSGKRRSAGARRRTSQGNRCCRNSGTFVRGGSACRMGACVSKPDARSASGGSFEFSGSGG